MEVRNQLKIIKRMRLIYWFALIYSSHPRLFYFLRKYHTLTSTGFCRILKTWRIKISDLNVLYSIRPNKDSSFGDKPYYWYKQGDRKRRYGLLVKIEKELKK